MNIHCPFASSPPGDAVFYALLVLLVVQFSPLLSWVLLSCCSSIRNESRPRYVPSWACFHPCAPLILASRRWTAMSLCSNTGKRKQRKRRTTYAHQISPRRWTLFRNVPAYHLRTYRLSSICCNLLHCLRGAIQKELMPAIVFALPGLLFALVPLSLLVLMWIYQ
jgi:hypothetical protein